MKNEHINLSNSEKIGMLTNLSTMLSAGIPILEVIETMLEDVKGNQLKVYKSMREDVIQGKHLYEAFSRFPNIFNKVTINIIKAAEEAGNLDQTLKDIKAQSVKDSEFRDKVLFALMYPALITVVMGGVMLMILIVVVPKIATVFSRMTIELPLPTKIMIWASNMLLTNTIPVVLVTVAFFAAVYFTYKRNRNLILQPLFNLPGIASLIRKMDLTIFTRNLSLLLAAGIPITSALELVQNVVVKKEIADTIKLSHKMILSGKNLSEGLKSHRHIIPTLMIKIIETGERSGSLDKSLQEISEYLDYTVSNELKAVTALLEPILLVIVAIAIGGMMAAIIAPIYGLIGSVGSR